MSLQGDNILLYLTGQPVRIKECNIILTPPTIRQIAMIGESSFLYIAQTMSNMDKIAESLREGNPQLKDTQDFQIFLALMSSDDNAARMLKDFFDLVFPNYEIRFSETDISFSVDSNLVGMVNSFNFVSLCQTIKEIFIETSSRGEQEIEYNPANEAARKIAEKIQEGRRKVATIKAKNGKVDKMSLFASYISTLSVGMRISIDVFLDCTPFQLYDLFNRYWLKEDFDTYKKISSTPLLDTSHIKPPEA